MQERNPLVIFGCGQIGELAHYYFTEDSDYQVVGFTADRAHLPDSLRFCGLPVAAFEEIERIHSPESCAMFIALSYLRINALRREKLDAARSKGYRIASYVSRRATVLCGHPIGDNCLILEDSTVQPFVRLGENVTLWSGSHVGHHSRIEDDCFIAGHVAGAVQVKRQSFIGVNSTIRNGLVIGERCVIGAGAVILSDAPDEAVHMAEPTPRSKVPSRRLPKI